MQCSAAGCRRHPTRAVAPAAAAAAIKVQEPARVTALHPRAPKADGPAINALTCANDMTINTTSQSIVVLGTRLSFIHAAGEASSDYTFTYPF